MAAWPQGGGTQRWIFGLVATAVLLLGWHSLAAQTLFYYDANGHAQGKVVCTDQACEVFASSTSIGKVTAQGTAYDETGYRIGHTSGYGQNWRPGNFWIRPELPAAPESSADPQGWAVPLQEALHSDAVGGDLDRQQLRALQAAAIRFGSQQKFVAASDPELQRRASSHESADANTLPAVVVHDGNRNAYIMVRGVWVLAVGKASNSNQVTVWWPGSSAIETAVAPAATVSQTLAAAGIVLSEESARVQRLPIAVQAQNAQAAKETRLCISGDARLRAVIENEMQSWAQVKLDCSDAGNDLVLSVNPTGRWIAVLQADDATPVRIHYPSTAFEAVGVLRNRAGQELWWIRKEAWNGRGDRTHVAQQIAKAFKKFYSAYPPQQRQAEHALEASRNGSGDQ